MYTTNVPQGTYTFSLNAHGTDTNGAPVTNNLLFVLQAGHVWNGSTNAAYDGAGLWSDSSKWLGGIPGAGDDVIFTDAGGQTNQLITTSSSTNYLTNCVIDADVTLSSLRFAQTNSATKAHTIHINSGRTLSITGTNGFCFLRDYIGLFAGLGSPQVMNVTILGANATLIVTNNDANFALLSDNASPSSTRLDTMNSLDLSQLGTFRVDVCRIGLGDYQLWPNLDSLRSNAYNANQRPWKMAAYLNMARTNVIRATYVDPKNFTNSVRRDYSLCLGNNEGGGTSSNPQYTINFGITNAFFLDSICFGHASLASVAQFPPAFATNYACVAIFRGTNGDRMSMWAESDLGRVTRCGSGSNDKTTVYFGGGKVDALVDRLYFPETGLTL